MSMSKNNTICIIRITLSVQGCHRNTAERDHIPTHGLAWCGVGSDWRAQIRRSDLNGTLPLEQCSRGRSVVELPPGDDGFGLPRRDGGGTARGHAEPVPPAGRRVVAEQIGVADLPVEPVTDVQRPLKRGL